MRSIPRSTAPDTLTAPAAGQQTVRWALLAGRLLLAVIFLIAAVGKIQAPTTFVEAVRDFHLLPEALVGPFALTLPWVELLVAFYLLVGFFGRVAAALTAAMLLMFIVALLDALITGNTGHPCGCFGATPNAIITALAGGDTVGWWDAIRDIILLCIALAIAWQGSGALSIDERVARRREAPAV